MKVSIKFEFLRSMELERSNVIIDQTLDGCKFLNGSLSNPFASWLFKILFMIVEEAKEVFHECNYHGTLNFTVNPVHLPSGMSFMRGSYRIMFRLFNSEDNNIGSSETRFRLI